MSAAKYNRKSMCKIAGCNVLATCGYPGKRIYFCNNHKITIGPHEPWPLCNDCDVSASCGFDDVPTNCATHSHTGMFKFFNGKRSKQQVVKEKIVPAIPIATIDTTPRINPIVSIAPNNFTIIDDFQSDYETFKDMIKQIFNAAEKNNYAIEPITVVKQKTPFNFPKSFLTILSDYCGSGKMLTFFNGSDEIKVSPDDSFTCTAIRFIDIDRAAHGMHTLNSQLKVSSLYTGTLLQHFNTISMIMDCGISGGINSIKSLSWYCPINNFPDGFDDINGVYKLEKNHIIFNDI